MKTLIDSKMRECGLQTNPRDYDVRKDEVSHFALRMAYCRTDELRRWFLQNECTLFKHKFDGIRPTRRRPFSRPTTWDTSRRQGRVDNNVQSGHQGHHQDLRQQRSRRYHGQGRQRLLQGALRGGVRPRQVPSRLPRRGVRGVRAPEGSHVSRRRRVRIAAVQGSGDDVERGRSTSPARRRTDSRR